MSTQQTQDEGVKSSFQIGERTINDIIADLSKPIPPRLLKSKTVGGTKIVFIPWYVAVKFLDYYAPGWCYQINTVTEVGNKLVLVARITIPVAQGHYVYREASGQEDEEVKGYGDSSSNSESMALRRAASKFGLGLSLYDNKPDGSTGSGTGQGQTYQRPAAAGFPAQQAPASTSSDTVTPRQLGMMRAICTEKNFDLDETCKAVMHGKESSDLSKREAIQFIDWLKAAVSLANG